MDEAAGTPHAFTYIIALFESETAGPPSSADSEFWADAVGLDTPVLSDPTQLMPTKMPYEGSIPSRCAMTPRMEMIECFTGEPADPDPAIEAIIAHAGG